MNKRTQMLGIVLATALSAGIGGAAYAAGSMTPEETAAELQQAFSLDADISQIVDATVRDGVIVLTGTVNDQQALDKVHAIIRDMEIDSSMIEDNVGKD
ncbi:BON domain-containing protein [Granulosicoccus antarcticus]|uniref:BON domain-containing protein n=1 Tax=Granulosicoccus antarcticus IMCC3135 TaxID=1192854 RepID=A0A2Z2NIJ8_9GAMM|nr:BON domain-containing protein [Granulosicoccus antarcticus]ASJ70873.1 hypothetical protein IMCC3135_03800 [Granulosicoccus antarcticus IMCC3135]